MVSDMVEVGVALVLVGVALLVAEAHVPSGALGAAGGIALAVGAALAISAAGAGAALVVAAVVASLGVAAAWLLIAARKSFATRRLRAASGREALSGRTGVVRSWNGDGGQVFVDGALWRARRSWDDGSEELGAGDAVVVEQVRGLTLGVRRAEEWEEDW
jgi:membrane-bound ClpP family serine protease